MTGNRFLIRLNFLTDVVLTVNNYHKICVNPFIQNARVIDIAVYYC